MGKTKKSYPEIQYLILDSFQQRYTYPNEIVGKTGLGHSTVKRHLIWLKGLDFVKEIYSHRRMSLFEITDYGKGFLDHIKMVNENGKDH